MFMQTVNVNQMLVQFYKLKPVAAYINIPYLLWVTFATVLNAAYFFLNRS
jgi:benzodiazapine receptor